MNPAPLEGSYDVGNCDYLENALNLNAQMGTLMNNLRCNNSGFGSIQSGAPTPLMMMNNRCNNILKPLDHDSYGSQPTLFQKRAALRKNQSTASNLQTSNVVYDYGGKRERGVVIDEERDRKVKRSSSGDDVEDLITVDGGYDSDDQFLENRSSGDNKGKKKKGLPAKNLMAERRRRKKLNDRLYMLRSVVPKISKVRMQVLLIDSFLVTTI